MKKLFNIVLSLLVIVMATGCFEIREEVDINAKGAGTYALLLDMSQSKALLDMLQKDEQKAKTPLSQMDSSFSKVSDRLNGMEGISNARGINNKTDYIFGMQFDFTNVDALNNALNSLNRDKNPDAEALPAVYKFSKGTLERTNNFYLNNVSDALGKKSGSDDAKAEQVKALFQSATYAYIVRTSGKIKKYSNKEAELSYTKKELRYSVSLTEVMGGKANPANVVKFK